MSDTEEYGWAQETVEGQPWVFIAVMGVTGAGKSTFIQAASENSSIEVGHNLQSCTGKLQGYSFTYQGYNINLIDTPGFNDTFKSETDVLQDIAEWLRDSYEHANKLSGIIYLHSIHNVRMEGSALRNLKMFRELCGSEPLKNVMLITTFWGKVDQLMAEHREEELRTTPDFWGGMLRRGSRMGRFHDTQKSALGIIDTFLKKTPITLQIQKELVDESKPLIETGAGQAVNEELLRVKLKHKEEQEKIQQEMRDALRERDEELHEILQEQQAKLDKELDKVLRQQEQLRADRRAEQRRMMNDFQAKTWSLEQQIQERDQDMKQKDQKFREWERKIAQQVEEVREMSFEQAVAQVRANESKLRIEEREQLEAKIKELSKRPEIKKRSKSGKFGKYLIGALQVAFPATTMALLGFPIPLPFSGALDSLMGNDESV